MPQISEQSDPIFVSRDALEQLIHAHDGDMALLYLYRLATADPNPEAAAAVLCKTRSEIDNASEKLQRLNLGSATGQSAAPPRPSAVKSTVQGNAPEKHQPAAIDAPDSLPEYSSEYIVKVADQDPAFPCLVDEAKKIIGRPLSTPEMQMLLGIYEYLGLPAEVVMELLNYCGDLYEEKYAGRRRPTAKVIEREAYTWANREIRSLEQAEEYIAAQKARSSDVSRVADTIGRGGRNLSQAERQYIDSWLDEGFSVDTIKIAYERTMISAGNFSWRYMDRILQNWASKNLFTPAEIEEKDARPGTSHNTPPSTSSVKVDMKGLQEFLNNI